MEEERRADSLFGRTFRMGEGQKEPEEIAPLSSAGYGKGYIGKEGERKRERKGKQTIKKRERRKGINYLAVNKAWFL